MTKVTLLSGFTYPDKSYLVPFSAGRYALLSEHDHILGEVHTAGYNQTARATAYRALTAAERLRDPSPGLVAVCPAHLAPTGPLAFPMALNQLRRAIIDC